MPLRDALIVDDDADSRRALAEFLEARGFSVREAGNGRVALDLIAERLPTILFLDLEMPVMTGWEVLASLKRATALQGMAVVVLSAGASPPPDVTFVRKPCHVDDLLATLGESPRVEGTSGEAARYPE